MERLIHALFEEQVKRSPEFSAVSYGSLALTYAELNSKANQLARYLRSKGIGAEQTVAICCDRSVEAIIAIMGVLKSGGAYVPLDPAYPPERLEYMIENCAPGILLTKGSVGGRLETTAEIIPLEKLLGELERWADSDLEALPGLTPQSLAYVLFTSGSTGRPKGAMVMHQGAVNLWKAFEPAFASCPEHARVSVNAGLAFDASVKLLVQLLGGRTLVIVPQHVREDPPALVRFARAERLDVLDCTPSYLKLLLAHGLAEDHPDNPGVVVVGGEPVGPETWNAAARLPRIRVYNLYGPTECSVLATMCQMTGSEPHIGRAVANVSVYILDSHLEPVPVGVEGEIHIGGAGVGRGYLGRPELTAERFLRDPFSSDPCGRMYKTGDIARWRPDGTIEFIGRNDFQVKIRGYRIELGEIEAQLMRTRRVTDAVVIAREDTPGEKRLVAYVTAPDTASVDVEALRVALESVLPDYMVPNAIVVLERLPLTANGKLDRAALPIPDVTDYARRRYEAPHGEVERVLAGIWGNLLRLDRIGRNDNFFELGGHSLLTTRVTARIREALHLDLPVRALFDAPTLRELSALIEEERIERALRRTDLERSVESMDDQSVMARIAELERELRQ